jgi:hypothetical protein
MGSQSSKASLKTPTVKKGLTTHGDRIKNKKVERQLL